MQLNIFNIKAIGTFFTILLFSFGIQAQCDYTDSISVSSTGGTSTDANFTQMYLLTGEDGNRIIETSSDGNFTALAAGKYFVYAYNYENANAPDPLPAPNGTIGEIGANSRGCGTLSRPLQDRAVTVCQGTQGCEAAPYEVSTSDSFMGAGYEQSFVLVCSDTITQAQTNTTSASFDLAALGVTAGSDCQVYAVNYETVDMPDFTVGAAWPNNAADDCLNFIGQNVTVEANGSDYCNLVLPLNLIYFKGSVENRAHQLDWRVAAETDVDYYEVQRSEDGISFFPIGIKEALNLGEGQTTDYTLTDRDVEPGRKYYYRLRMVENTGEFNYSNIIILYQSVDDKLTVLGAEPNPALSIANIAFVTNTEEQVTYIISDVLGRKVITGQVETVRGYNKVSINIEKLAAAPYIITIFKKGEHASARFIKR